jgi:hypothetical protein
VRDKRDLVSLILPNCSQSHFFRDLILLQCIERHHNNSPVFINFTFMPGDNTHQFTISRTWSPRYDTFFSYDYNAFVAGNKKRLLSALSINRCLRHTAKRAMCLKQSWKLPFCHYRALDHFSTEEYVTSSVLGQGVFDSPSLTLVIGANIF